jgi:DNA-binding CsgD family transcriptional regulator/tetratricopeptide (TPR) repeat protein
VELSRFGAVELFVSRAQATMPMFQLTATNVHTIAEICARLDGLPLAIELAAARVKVLSPQVLLARLEHRLQVLTQGSVDLPERQQTLRNTLAWSYDLLSPQEQRLFRHLTAFVGGFTLEAAEAVCKTLGDETMHTLEDVASLLDKNLVQQTVQVREEEQRFFLLETIREFGLEALAACGETETIRQAHAAYYLGLAEEAEPEWEGPQQAVWSERLEREHDNVRAAMLWSLEQGETGHDWELSLRLGGALRRFWQVRGYLSEGRAFLEQVLAGSAGIVSAGRVKALIAMGHVAVVQSNPQLVEAACKESLILCQQLGDTVGSASTLYLLGWISWMRGDLAAARSLIEQTVALFKQIGDKSGLAWSLMHLAITVGRQGDYAKGRALFEENLARQRELRNKRGIAFSLCNFALMLIEAQYDLATVRPMLEEGLAFFREIGDKWGIATAFMLLGQVALQQGDVTTARSLTDESVRLCKEVGHRWVTSQSLALFATVAVVQHDKATARALYQESLDLAREVGDKVLIASGLEGLAGVVATQGEPVWATQLWGAAAALRDTIDAPMPAIERAGYGRATAAVRMHLGEKAFAAAWATGRTMTPEQVLLAQDPATMHQQVSTGVVSVPHVKVPSYPAGLTAREVEVLRLVALGLTDAQVAEQLVISPRTVNTHLTSIYGKTGVSSRSAATRYAMDHHLV